MTQDGCQMEKNYYAKEDQVELGSTWIKPRPIILLGDENKQANKHNPKPLVRALQITHLKHLHNFFIVFGRHIKSIIFPPQIMIGCFVFQNASLFFFSFLCNTHQV